MPTELDLATLAAEVERLASTEAHRWKVEQVVGQLCVYVTLSPLRSIDIYCLRLDFSGSLASGPPSVTFCDPASHAEGRLQDWPNGLTGYFKHPPGNGVGWICNPWTREGRAHHAEWRGYPWGAKRAVWRVTTAIQDILDHPGAYTGRAQ